MYDVLRQSTVSDAASVLQGIGDLTSDEIAIALREVPPTAAAAVAAPLQHGVDQLILLRLRRAQQQQQLAAASTSNAARGNNRPNYVKFAIQTLLHAVAT